MQKEFEQLKVVVFGRQKVLAKIYQEHGAKNLYEYVNGWSLGSGAGLEDVFLRTLREALAEIYSANLAGEVALQLRAVPLVSTIDHHGILNHPFFVNSNLVFSFRDRQKYLLCLSTAGVSLNNSSWPGSLVFNSKVGLLRRVSFFPDKLKTSCVLSAPPLGAGHMQKVLGMVDKDIDFSPHEKVKLQDLVKETFSAMGKSKFTDFSGQASQISSSFWQKFFPGAPGVVYLPVENLIEKLITEVIIPDAGHFLHQLFFTNEGLRLLEKYFTGTLGTFSGGHKRSFLFWGVDSKGRRVHLCREGRKLVGEGIEIDLVPDAVADAFRKKIIYPTSLVCFLVLLYYRVTCLGGFNQVNWVTEIKEKFLGLLGEMNRPDLIGQIEPVATKNFAEANLAFLFKGSRLIKATGIDIYLSGLNAHLLYQNLAKELTLKESIESLLPEIYRVIVPAGERDPDFLSLTDEAIAEQNGMAEKIRKALS